MAAQRMTPSLCAVCQQIDFGSFMPELDEDDHRRAHSLIQVCNSLAAKLLLTRHSAWVLGRDCR